MSALCSALEKRRGSACGAAGEETDSPQARAVLAGSRSSLGLPLYRVASYHAMLGGPVPDATQGEQIARVADWASPVFGPLECLAAQGELISQDDTPVRNLALSADNPQAQAQAEALGGTRSKERPGMSTTAVVVKGGERPSCLYYSGRPPAGENLAALVSPRGVALEQPGVMSDALTSHTADEETFIRCHCLAHGRRKCRALEEVFPQACHVVIAALQQVFAHDEAARVQQRSAPARLVDHQPSRRPLMEALKRWLTQRCDARLGAPNGSLGKALAYLLGHGETLTQFFSGPGAPLDHNLVERALTLFLRQRKNSRFFATEPSADIASGLTSLLATCLHAGGKALESLVALQAPRAEGLADPAAWLPWTSLANLAPP